MLRWARERVGYTVEDLSKAFPNYRAWELDEDSPTYPQLERLADDLSVSTSVFFLPSPPESKQAQASFRTLRNFDVEKLPKRLRKIVLKAQFIQQLISDFFVQGDSAKAFLTNVRNAEAKHSSIAEAARDALDLTMDVQRSWRDPENAVKWLREALYNERVVSFKEAFRDNRYVGFCLHDDAFPVIYINNSMTPSRQLFTLAHELGHILFEHTQIDTNEDIEQSSENRDPYEAAANSFAGDFLFPPSAVDLHVQEAITNAVEASERVAELYSISREVALRRFADRQLVTSEDYNAAVNDWAARRSRNSRSSGGSYYNTQMTYLGRWYVRDVYTRFQRRQIDTDEAGDLLDIAPKNVPEIFERLERSL